MKKNIPFKLLILIGGISTTIIYLIISSSIGENKLKSIKSLLTIEQMQLIRKYVFPYKLIAIQEKKINELYSLIPVLESIKKESGSEIEVKESIVTLSNKMLLKKYKLTSGFYTGIRNIFPGSGYIDFFKDNLFVISSRGILAFSKLPLENNTSFKQIQNNIDDFLPFKEIDVKQSDIGKFSIKDLLIFKNTIYVSYTQEIKKGCWNTGIISGDLNFNDIKFKKLFSAKDCVSAANNQRYNVGAHQSGGRIIPFRNNKILLSVGDYSSMDLPQDDQSINGKIISINTEDGKYEIISKGHRNPQGLYFDKENNIILETEHGPQGGDEINLIKVENINKKIIKN